MRKLGHRSSEIGNAFGGYNCTCGEPWLVSYGGCLTGQVQAQKWLSVPWWSKLGLWWLGRAQAVYDRDRLGWDETCDGPAPHDWRTRIAAVMVWNWDWW